ncbi:hypothetical protein TCAL_09859 [Tigriopus californicus]|uniref:Uncharacterized protein n=1 Tax=Tigriopus californicus TaxID=6832 RepID=A0A553PDG7_TIGCA|nr:hypothetical protein TCAL_09859 [Tigriopus californicus]|eukprot:TCALIF_09859-PA protein Name:"Protein of unknown function" AED:0.68 eAED:0.68 QI:99/0/0.25/0.25/1/1/4/0/192
MHRRTGEKGPSLTTSVCVCACHSPRCHALKLVRQSRSVVRIPGWASSIVVPQAQTGLGPANHSPPIPSYLSGIGLAVHGPCLNPGVQNFSQHDEAWANDAARLAVPSLGLQTYDPSHSLRVSSHSGKMSPFKRFKMITSSSGMMVRYAIQDFNEDFLSVETRPADQNLGARSWGLTQGEWHDNIGPCPSVES